jgi:hypothetical protein
LDDCRRLRIGLTRGTIRNVKIRLYLDDVISSLVRVMEDNEEKAVEE